MTQQQKMEKLAAGVAFFDYASQRANAAGLPSEGDSSGLIRQGIADLDFDPVYFLGTGETSPEGWAVK